MFTNNWTPFLNAQFRLPYFQQLAKFLHQEYAVKEIFPPKGEVFNAFKYTDLNQIKVVIIGQDPYFHQGEACGLCFAVKPGIKIPPSLRNIYQEIHDDIGLQIPNNGYLVPWANQGVMLLNTVLTVQANSPMSHNMKGWEVFTDNAIKEINKLDQPIVFLLWGSKARSKTALLNNPKHLILQCAHPSPLSAYNGFFGCKHFSKTNNFLKEKGVKPIDWRIPNV